MDSIETAHLQVSSPKGGYIRIEKRSLSKATPDQRVVFWKFCKDPMCRFIGKMEATKEEMIMLYELSQLK